MEVFDSLIATLNAAQLELVQQVLALLPYVLLIAGGVTVVKWGYRQLYVLVMDARYESGEFGGFHEVYDGPSSGVGGADEEGYEELGEEESEESVEEDEEDWFGKDWY